MWVSNFGQNMDSKMVLRLIHGSTYMRVYKVKVLAQVPVSDSTSSTLEDVPGSFPDL